MPVEPDFLNERFLMSGENTLGASVQLEVIIIAKGDERLVFGHLNERFSVALKDVIDISDTLNGIANPFNEGFPAK
ncbi:hypothetical protein HV221_00345 [Citrobacter freundii]|uniref:hypothetical protein n=1 Tax=Citrobacter freundii TaxID=546 RepID=UPI0015E9D2CA|nr:hypothetical protein [Citrobacter freundii]QLX91697.1 hypothetical protein HV221_00345 [Citrobacter freundii]